MRHCPRKLATCRLVGARRARSLAGLVGVVALASSCTPNPGEMPPLAPRPGPVQPMPSPAPVPGAPDPLDPLDPSRTGPTSPQPTDAGVPVIEIAPPQFRSAGDAPPTDSGVADDATVLPPLPDALPEIGDALH